MLVPHLVLFLVLLSVACLVVLEVQIWVLLLAWLVVLQLERPLVVRLDQKSQQQRESVYRDQVTPCIITLYQDGVYQPSSPVYSNDEIFDSSNSGDDRIYDFNDRDYTGSYSAQQPVATIPSSTLEELGAEPCLFLSLEIMICLILLNHSNEDNTLNRNETAKVIFEIRNNGSHTLYDVVPTVIETTGNKHIFISPSVHVESIACSVDVIRYTAMVKA